MWNFQRIICIWICCVSCMFGTTQLSSLVAAVPYEYFDDHDQSFYDLDTEQIQAKYDTRLLSQQMLASQDQPQPQQHQQFHQQQQQQQKHQPQLENSEKGSLPTSSGNAGIRNSHSILAKLKSNDASNANNNGNKQTEWLPATTAAITERQEIHLPRAASCYTNGQKYTHGQKVPRSDSCEVCLCMDGEIFCWWEKCDKKRAKAKTTYNDYSTPYEESSTMRMQLNEKSTARTTQTPRKKPKINRDYKYDDDSIDNDEVGITDDDDDDDATGVDDEGEEDEIASELEDDEVFEDIKQQSNRPYKSHNKQTASAKKFRGERPQEIKQTQKAELLKKKQQQQPPPQQKKQQALKQKQKQQQPKQQQHKSSADHHYHHPADHHASSGSSKILNFPENLPSVLYYDYKTEEHHQHQHQHHEQHLRHQHEKELKPRHGPVSHHHEYGEGLGHAFGAGASQHSESSHVGADNAAMRRQQPASLSGKHLASGNDNIYSADLQTDSDILPEPPTKKPKLPTDAASATTMVPAREAFSSSSSSSTLLLAVAPASSLDSSSSTAGTTIAAITAGPLKKQMFSPWDYDTKPNRDKLYSQADQKAAPQTLTANRIDDPEVLEEDDQDDAFHRWLTSTEKNNKNGRGSGGDFGNLNDYNLDDRIYENIDIDIDATLPVHATAMMATKPLEPVSPATPVEADMPKYEINFTDNIRDEGISPFSNPYQSNKISNPLPSAGRVGQSQRVNGSEVASEAQAAAASSSTEDNAAVGSVVNIDIMLTASADMAQQQQHQHQLSSQHDKQIAGQASAEENHHLISNTNDEAPLSLANSTSASTSTSTSGSGFAPSGPDHWQQPKLGDAMLNSSTDPAAPGTGSDSTSSRSYSHSDSYKFNHSQQPNATEPQFGESAALSPLSSAPPLLASLSSSSASSSLAASTVAASTTLSPERQCNVMGTLYKIGDVLPQDTGNCLQCICIDGSTMDDTPRVTCSPHNCPPLVLPDLFDATGY